MPDSRTCFTACLTSGLVQDFLCRIRQILEGFFKTGFSLHMGLALCRRGHILPFHRNLSKAVGKMRVDRPEVWTLAAVFAIASLVLAFVHIAEEMLEGDA